MPRRDGTGPMGMGPMTGRGRGNCFGLGHCLSYGIPLFIGTIAAIGFRRGFGWKNRQSFQPNNNQKVKE